MRLAGTRGALVVVLAGLGACSGATPATDAGSEAATDGAPTVDAPADVAVDAGPTLPACTVAAPLVAGTAATDMIADAPARCGAAAYRWLRSERLGEVVSRTRSVTFTPRTIQALAGAAGAEPTLPLTHDVAVDTLVYVTQDRGALVQSTAALAYPTDLAQRATLPVVLVTHGTSGWTTGCGPTRDVPGRLLVAAFASAGFVAVAPDYLGLESAGTPYGAPPPYLVGEPTAIASLDAVRAGLRALADLRAPACGASDVLVWGPSQGGHAALFVERYAPYYARELALRGVVAVVPPSNLVAHLERALSAPMGSTDFFVGFLGTAPAWYGHGARLAEVFAPPRDTQVPAALAAGCSPELPPNDPLSGEFTAPVLDAAARAQFGALDPWGCIAREASLGATSVPRLASSDPAYGVLYVVGEQDELVDIAIERAAYDAQCAAGAPLNYLECQGAGHLQTALWSLRESITFLRARAAGAAFTPVCTRSAAVRCSGTPAMP